MQRRHGIDCNREGARHRATLVDELECVVALARVRCAQQRAQAEEATRQLLSAATAVVARVHHQVHVGILHVV